MAQNDNILMTILKVIHRHLAHVQKPYLTMVVNIHIVVGIDQATTGQQEGEARVRGQRRLRPPVRLWLAGVRQSAQQQPHQAQLWRGRRSWLLFWS